MKSLKKTKRFASKTLFVGGNKPTAKQIKETVRFFNTYNRFPGSVVICNASYRLVACTGTWAKRMVARYGSAEQFLTNYKSVKGFTKKSKTNKKGAATKRKRVAATKTKAVATANRKKKKDKTLPQVSYNRRPMTKTELAKTSETQCLRPDIFLTNGRHCDGCGFFDICENALKAMPVDRKGKERTIKRINAN